MPMERINKYINKYINKDNLHCDDFQSHHTAFSNIMASY